MLESKVKKKLCEELEKRGWFVKLIIKTSGSGDPDIYTFKNGRTVWIETKQANKSAIELQKYKHSVIRSFGMECIVISGIEEVKEYLNNLK